MSSSEDDVPLQRTKGRNSMSNGKKSEATVARTSANFSNGVTSSPAAAGAGISRTAVEDNNAVPATSQRGSRMSNGKNYKDLSSDSEDIPLNKRRRPSTKIKDDSDSEEVPLAKKKMSNGTAKNGKNGTPIKPEAGVKDLAKEKAEIEKAAVKEAKALRKEDSKKTSTKRKIKDESDEEPSKKKRLNNGSSAKVSDKSTEKGKKAAKKVEAEEDEEDEDANAWWLDPSKSDGTKKWDTLEHNGVVFPPPYQPLPKNVKLYYEGQPVVLAPEAEEVAGFFGAMLNSTHNVENPTFQKNFFDDFKAILKETGGAKDKSGNKISIKEFSKLDFKKIFEYYDSERERKKAFSKEEKKRIKEEKDELEAPYLYCTWDGKKQRVGNFRVEPPGLFRGRGEHPKTGKVKQRVTPEQITINIGTGAKVPNPPAGHKWKEVKHDTTGTWLATWQENINGNYKYVMLAADSDVKGMSDYKKFEKSRELKKHIDAIREDYTRELESKVMAERQRATAVYLIDRFALRAGNEKGEDEADTVGCCSLKFEHITLQPPNTVIFDFLGKDSIRYYDEAIVSARVFKNLKLFKKEPKGPGDEIFDRLDTSGLNKHLSHYMPGLTAKVFRTYNASWTMSQELKKLKPEGTVQKRFNDFKDANRTVAILCNHKKTVTATHGQQMEKIGDKIKGMKYQKWRLKQMILDVDPKQKKKKPAGFFDLDEELDQEWILEWQKHLVEQEETKITKKFEKDNEKLVKDGQKEMKAKELTERLEAAKELAATFKKENKSHKVEADMRGATVEKLDDKIQKMQERIDVAELQAEDRENNKEVALTTSLTNYIDPRIVVAFSKRFEVPLEKFLSKRLREKFEWAVKSTKDDWEF